jgi:hypothetical protein
MNKIYKFRAKIQKNPEMDAAFVAVPFDIREKFGRGKLAVRATFDGEIYDGQIVNMGVKNADGSICYIIGITRKIRAGIGKNFGDEVAVSFVLREKIKEKNDDD